jgi:hypothetical protein
LAWGDGGKARIPSLKYMVDKVEMLANTNLNKGHTLAKGFFPTKPPADNMIAVYNYPPQCEHVGKITSEQINV